MHTDPFFDTREYDIEFTDGTQDKYTANLIMNNMYAQVDEKGYQFKLSADIQDHRKYRTAISKEEGKIRSANGTERGNITTRGWEVMVLYKDGLTDCIQLKDIKESKPVEVAEYAVTNRIQDKPAFACLVSKVLRCWNIIIFRVKSKYWKTTHKFGIRLPKTVAEALRIDKEAVNDYWYKALNKDMSKVNFAWKRVDGVTLDQKILESVKELTGHQEINCSIIFDVRMEFQQK